MKAFFLGLVLAVVLSAATIAGLDSFQRSTVEDSGSQSVHVSEHE